MKVELTISLEHEEGRPAIYRLGGTTGLPLSTIHEILTRVATDVMVKMTANTVFDILQERAQARRIVTP